MDGHPSNNEVAGYPASYDHGHGDEISALESNPIWLQENVTLLSVGIDIGSSGTQVIFSEVKLQRNGAGLSTRFVVVGRKRLFLSPISFTPFDDGFVIDVGALGSIIDRAYSLARIDPESVDTGIVILTGEALRRENAERIATVVSERAGDFVCAAAGHHMEATLAAFGSGAVQLSKDTKKVILNVDIGGGTTKLSLIDRGRIVHTSAIQVGGRLLVVDRNWTVIRLEDAVLEPARVSGVDLHLGGKVTPSEMDDIAAAMVSVLESALLPDPPGEARGDIPYLAEPVEDLGRAQAVVFSGGVAEYIYGTEERDFGDLGRRLGQSLRSKIEEGRFPYELLPALERIRATAIGASEFSIQLSGNTCYLADAGSILPKRNLQVIRPDYNLAQEVDVAAVADAIRSRVEAFTTPLASSDVVLGMTWSGELSYQRLRALAEAVVLGLARRISEGRSVLLAFDADMAKALGGILRDELKLPVELLVVDGVNLLDFDYVDMGHPLQPSLAVPITIKSLVF